MNVWVPRPLLRLVLSAVLVLSLAMISCYALPLSSLPARPEPGFNPAVVLDTNTIAGPVDNHPENDYKNPALDARRDVSENELRQTIHLRHLRLDSREIGWKKALDKWLLDSDGFGLIGFAYSQESIARAWERRYFPLHQLQLPGVAHPDVPTNHTYLVPRSRLPTHILNETRDPYWTCSVYAKKSRLVKNKPLLVFENNGEPPLYPALSFEPVPPYTVDPTVNNLDPLTTPHDLEYKGTNRVTFFDNEEVGAVMRILTEEFSTKWKLKAQCYKSSKYLPKAVDWNDIWQPVHGLPKGRINLVI